jgi:hypothetical protein
MRHTSLRLALPRPMRGVCLRCLPLNGFLLALAFTASVHGEVIYNNFAPGDGFSSESSDTVGDFTAMLAVPFTSFSPFALDSLTVAMSHVNGGDAVRLTVRPDAAGVPADSVLDAIDMGGFMTGQGTVQTAQSTLRPLLDGGVTYWAVVEPMALGNVFRWNLAATPSYGRAYRWGSVWYADLETANALRVEGTVVPEPSTFALLGMGVIGLLGYAWRRRKTA